MAVIETRPVRQMPAWLSTLIIVACLALAGGVAWWYWHGGWSDNLVILDHNPGDGVHPTRGVKNQWDITAGPADAKVIRAHGETLDVSFFFNRMEFLSPEQIKVLSAVKQIARDSRIQQDLGVTPAQAQALADIRAGAKIQLSEAEEQRIRDAFLAWEKASGDGARDAANGDMIRVLDAIATTRLQAVKSSAVGRAALAKKVLTDEQWKQYDALGK